MIEISEKVLDQKVPSPMAVAWAAQRIASADGLIIAAGAGMGVDSGMPDFRGNAGFWKAYPALARKGIAFMDVAAPATFYNEPRRAWGFYGHRLALYRNTVPHLGYHLLRQWAAAMPQGYLVFTSNVDGHFQKAGYASARIAECHGSIHELQCLQPCSLALWSAAGITLQVDSKRCELLGTPPTCPRCGGTARPNILLFNDSAWIGEHYEQQAMLHQAWIERLRRPVVIEIGAGVGLPTVRRFSQRLVLQHGATLIRINPHQPHVGNLAGIGIASGALPTLSAIDAELRKSIVSTRLISSQSRTQQGKQHTRCLGDDK